MTDGVTKGITYEKNVHIYFWTMKHMMQLIMSHDIALASKLAGIYLI